MRLSKALIFTSCAAVIVACGQQAETEAPAEATAVAAEAAAPEEVLSVEPMKTKRYQHDEIVALDVLGFSPGVPAADVLAALKAQGWEGDMAEDAVFVVGNEVVRRPGAWVKDRDVFTKGAQTVEIRRFIDLEGVERVDFFSILETHEEPQDILAWRDRLVERYGVPSLDNVYHGLQGMKMGWQAGARGNDRRKNHPGFACADREWRYIEAGDCPLDREGLQAIRAEYLKHAHGGGIFVRVENAKDEGGVHESYIGIESKAYRMIALDGAKLDTLFASRETPPEDTEN